MLNCQYVIVNLLHKIRYKILKQFTYKIKGKTSKSFEIGMVKCLIIIMTEIFPLAYPQNGIFNYYMHTGVLPNWDFHLIYKNLSPTPNPSPPQSLSPKVNSSIKIRIKKDIKVNFMKSRNAQ